MKEDVERVGLYVKPDTRRELNVLRSRLGMTQDEAIRLLLERSRYLLTVQPEQPEK